MEKQTFQPGSLADQMNRATEARITDEAAKGPPKSPGQKIIANFIKEALEQPKN